MVVKLLAMESMRSTLNVLHLLDHHLLLGEVLFLSSHEVLLLLLPSLQSILLFSRKRSAKAGKAARKWRLS